MICSVNLILHLYAQLIFKHYYHLGKEQDLPEYTKYA